MKRERCLRKQRAWHSIAFIICFAPVTAVAPQAGQTNSRPNPTEFRNPPKQYRPWTVWWWFGNASNEEDLAFELSEMDKAGIGGAEINPVYALSEDDPEKQIANLPLFSKEWQRRLAAALQEAEKRNMTLILRGGSGWPYRREARLSEVGP